MSCFRLVSVIKHCARFANICKRFLKITKRVTIRATAYFDILYPTRIFRMFRLKCGSTAIYNRNVESVKVWPPGSATAAEWRPVTRGCSHTDSQQLWRFVCSKMGELF